MGNGGKGGGKLGLTTFSLHANTASSRLLGDGSKSKSKASGLGESVSALLSMMFSMSSMVSGGWKIRGRPSSAAVGGRKSKLP